RVAQLVMVWMTGGYAAATDPEIVRVERLVRESGIGGVVISLGTPHDYVSRLNRLQAAAEVPLLVAADFEAGPGYRVGGVYALPNMLDLGGATRFPPAMAFGATDDEGLAYEAGRITAVESRALGVHLNFAPVLDVNNNPENPIINTRSLGEDPDRVAALGAAYVRGARDAGLLTTAKHFPGHGDTGTDSHVALPVIQGDRARLDALELVPFKRAIEEGVEAVMTAHVAAPSILGDEAPPATLSPYFMTELLREDLGFDGVLFTDALDMAAVVDGYGAQETAIRALEAGADVLLMPTEPTLAIEAVVSAVERGRLSEERIEASVRRVLKLKALAGLDRSRSVSADGVADAVGIDAHTAFADSVARRSITLVRDDAAVVPFDPRVSSILSLTFARADDLAAGTLFDRRLGERMAVTSARVDFEAPAERYDSLLA
ncbi:MAG: beta-N-acetylglucosaminidase, partial [Gemmatimonadetes bacterium]|nr:beta-N-acetylglucosaminidase [Gemmatimonadota bacterium]